MFLLVWFIYLIKYNSWNGAFFSSIQVSTCSFRVPGPPPPHFSILEVPMLRGQEYECTLQMPPLFSISTGLFPLSNKCLIIDSSHFQMLMILEKAPHPAYATTFSLCTDRQDSRHPTPAPKVINCNGGCPNRIFCFPKTGAELMKIHLPKSERHSLVIWICSERR
jgi:hypothetical protein